MQFFSILLTFIVGLNMVTSYSNIEEKIIGRFKQWVSKFNIRVNDNFHFESLLQKWISNDLFIEIINSDNRTYVLGHNQFSGMDSQEFSNYLGFIPETRIIRNLRTSFDLRKLKVPDSVNWIDDGGVTGVKDQGQCGSCWAFSTTGALEGAYYVKTRKLTSFSEQQLVDCDTTRNGGKDHGCNGGLMDNAFSWIEKNNGLCSEAEYPYVSGDTKTGATCATSCQNIENSAVHSFIDVHPSSDEYMMQALAKQPVSVAIEADQREFQLYKSGVFTGTCGTKLDHGVLVVGYGNLDGEDYYLVKNSWSTSWGQNGYIMLGRGTSYNSGNGQCGVLLQGSYPVL